MLRNRELRDWQADNLAPQQQWMSVGVDVDADVDVDVEASEEWQGV